MFFPKVGVRSGLARNRQLHLPGDFLDQFSNCHRLLQPHHKRTLQVLRQDKGFSQSSQEKGERQGLHHHRRVLRLLRPLPFRTDSLHAEPDPGCLRLQRREHPVLREGEHPLADVPERLPGSIHLLFSL